MFTHESLFWQFCQFYPNVVVEGSIDSSWYPLLNEVFHENPDKLAQLNNFLENLQEPVNPAREHIWAFTRFCTPSEVKVVIMGQDPYPGEYLENVMGFSINRPKKYIPPSLKVILKEVEADIKSSTYAHTLKGFPPRNGCLEQWAGQGVLLLDSVLTVTQKNPGSHRDQGWEEIVGSILRQLQIHNCKNEGALVFMLWGEAAGDMEERLLQRGNKLILKAGHPSPNNENEDFSGCKHFSRANDFLVAAGEKPIDWSLTL